MPFPAATGILLPADFSVVHRVYSEIVAEGWFTPVSERREQFALTVIDAFRSGMTEPGMLSVYCREVALRKFGNAAAPPENHNTMDAR